MIGMITSNAPVDTISSRMMAWILASVRCISGA